MRAAVLLAPALLALLPAGAAEPGGLPTWWATARTGPVLEDLPGTSDIAVAPDGSIWYNDLYQGNVMRFDPATGAKKVQFHVDVVNAFDERGLAGLALDPDFDPDDPVYYIYYTYPNPANESGGWNRLSRIADGREHVLLDKIPAYIHHNGGRIVFAPDGTMFVGVGEIYAQTPAQDPGTVLGKILHLTRDGEPAPGTAKHGIYSTGHRNMYGLAIHPRTGELWETENSGWHRDEVNIIRQGRNYGYPICEGFSLMASEDPCPAEYERPLLEFYHTKTAGPTGAAFFQGEFYWASWVEGSIHWLGKDADGAWADARVWDPLQDAKGRRSDVIGDLEVGLDGRTLYYSSWKAIWKLEFPDLPKDAPPPSVDPPPPDGRVPGATGVEAERPTPAPLGLAALGAAALALARRRCR